jgi:glycine cleavage system H protein
MKEIGDLKVPEGLRYTKDHEWAEQKGGKVRVGVSDYAQDQLGEIVFVEMPSVGASLEKGKMVCSLESVKAVSEVYMPIAGEIVAINTNLESSPELVNSSPYEEGWLVEVQPKDAADWHALMDQTAYLEMLKGQK